MAIKTAIRERCSRCNEVAAVSTPTGIKVWHKCSDPVHGPPSPPRLVPWSGAFLAHPDGTATMFPADGVEEDDFNFVVTKTVEVTDPVSTGKAFANLRSKLGLTQQEVADLCGLTRNHIQNLEHGRRGWTDRTAGDLKQTLKELIKKRDGAES